MSDIIVTGSAGFLASHLLPSLLSDGHRVTGVDIVHPDDAWRLDATEIRHHPNFTYVWGSAGEWQRLPENGIVIHAAAVTDVRFASASPRYTLERNFQDMARLLEECVHQGVGQVIVFSTHSVYGKQLLQPIPEDVALHPSNFYGAAKAAQELLALSYFHEKGLPVTVVRPALMFGERERTGALVTTFLRKALHEETITLDGGGMQTRDMCYVGNTVQAIKLLLNADWAKGEVFNIGSGEEISIRRLALLAEQIAKTEKKRPTLVDGRARDGEEGRLFLDSTKIMQHGYKPEVGFTEGVERTSRWVRGRL